MSEIVFTSSDLSSQQFNEVRQKYEDLPAGESLKVVFSTNPEVLLQELTQSHEKYSYEVLENGPIQWSVQIKRRKSSCCGFCGE